MTEPILKTGITGTVIEDALVQACADLKTAAHTLDTLEAATRGQQPHGTIEEIYNHIQEGRTILSEILADHLIDKRKRLSL